MNDNLNKQIRERLNLKTTGELLEIWLTNDHVDWSDAAFATIKEILAERGEDIPEQADPIYEHIEEVDTVKEFRFTSGEMKIIEAKDQPELYDPLDVLLIKKRIEQAAVASIVLTIFSTLLNFPQSNNMASYLLQSFPSLTSLVFPISVTATLIAIGMAVVTTYLPLKALARILQILMEMEFNSRIDK